MNDEIVERVLNSDDEDVGSVTSIDKTSDLIGTILSVLILMALLEQGYIEVPHEVLNLDVLWIAVWSVMILGGLPAVVALSAYIAPRFGLVALPIGLGLAIVDVYVVLPRAFFFVMERFVARMQLAAYPDFLSGLLALAGVIAIAGPIALLAVGVMIQGVRAGLPWGGEQEVRE